MRSFSVFWLVFVLFLVIYLIFSGHNKSKKSGNNLDIAIVTVITNTTSRTDYDVAMKTVECYAKVQNYKFLVLVDSDFSKICHQNHKFFLRHCIIAHILPRYDVIMFIDADHGVVNPKRRIEEFLEGSESDLTFYDRFFDWEVMADWANFESKMPKVKHGSDNSALHVGQTTLVLAETLFSESYPEKVELCREAYYKASNTLEIGTYIACIRQIFGAREEFGRVRIIRKGAGWSRDDWLTSGVWSPARDFMLHGWKSKNLRTPPNSSLDPIPMNYAHWYNPLGGPIVLENCFTGNTTWSYNPRLLGDRRRIDESLEELERKIDKERAKSIGKLHEILERA